MKLDIKKLLLAGTAIVAVGASPLMITPAHAVDEFSVDADDSGTFTAAAPDETFDTGSAWTGTENNHDLRVDASGNITVGDTDVIGDGTAAVPAIGVNADALTLTLNDDAAADAFASVTIDGDISVGTQTSFNLTVNGVDDADGNDDLDVDVNGLVNLGTGVLTITADDDTAGNDVSFMVSGNVTAGSISLDDGSSDAVLLLDGTTAQVVTGTIDGAAAGEGFIGVHNAAGVTFASDIGTTSNTLNSINVGLDGTAGVSATFQGDVATANGIIIGDTENATTVDVVSVTFDTTGGATAVNGTVDANATDTANVIVSGGNVVTSDSDWGVGNALNSVTLSGTGTGLTTGGDLTATTVTVGAGTTLTTGGDVTGAVNLSGAGTVALGDNFSITGAVDNTSGSAGVGTLTSASAGGNTSTVTGNVGATNALSAITLTGTGTFDFDGTVAATTITSASTGTLDFADDVTGAVNLAADATVLLADGADITGAVNNTSGADGAGNITIAGSSTISGAVGASNTLNVITVNGVGTSNFSSTVSADDITFGGAATVNFAGNVTTTNDIDFANNAGTVNFADNVNLTGVIVDSGGPAGTVNFAGTSTVSGAITTADVNFNGGAGETVTLGGTVTSTNIDIDGAGTVQANADLAGAVNFGADGTLNLADGSDVTGAITATTGGEGSVVFAANGDMDAFGTDGNELKVFTILGTGNVVGAGGAFEAAATNNIDGNTVNVTGTVDVDTAQVLNFDVTGATAAGQITATGAATVAADAVLAIDVSTGDAIANNQSFTLIDGTGGAGVADLTTTITDNSFLLSFAQDTANDEDLVVVATVATTASGAATTNNTAVAGVFDAIGTSTDTQIAQIQQNIGAASTQDALNDVLEATLPTVDAGAIVSTVNVTNQSLNVIGTRLAEVRDEKVGTGMFAGNGMYGTQVWGQFFGNLADQDERDNVAGFEADTYGIAFGIDTADRLEGVTIGLAGSYASTEVDSDNINRTKTDIDSWQLAVYGDYELSDTAFLNAMVGYSYNDIESTRHDVGGISGLNANGDSDGNQYFARAELGNDYYMDELNGAILTPTALLNYIHVDQDGYTETGAGGASLVVNPDDLDILEIGLGLEASWKKQMADGGLLEPAVHIGYRYDVIGDDAAATSSFTGGGATFKTEGFDPAQSTFNAGFGATVYNTNNWEFTGGYDFEYKSDYTAHSGVVKATYKF